MAETLKRTPLYEAHKALGARLVPFGGWEMPVQYPAGILDEHRTVRNGVGLFDVSHMGEIVFRGPRATQAVQRLMTNNIGKLADGHALYTVMCYEHGGIVDDCIVYRRSATELLVIVNASNIDKDYAWMREQSASIADIANESDAYALISVQGPKAPPLVSRLAGQPLADTVGRNMFVPTSIAGVAITMAARTGYTGEDGFELLCAAGDAPRLWAALLEGGQADGVLPIGLGARDTLRLEARLSLYGNDIDDTTSPLEAGLGWVVKFDAGDWVGKPALQAQKQAGVSRKLVGFVGKGRGIARHDYIIYPEGWPEDASLPALGKVTSGTTAPSLGMAVGMGYVPVAKSEPGTRLSVDCRGKAAPFEIVAGPFYKRSK